MGKHLSNPKDAAANKPSEVRDAAKIEAVNKANEKKFAEQKGPIEPATKDDFQFVQAMNQLKGLPVMKTPEVKAADKAADVKTDEMKK